MSGWIYKNNAYLYKRRIADHLLTNKIYKMEALEKIGAFAAICLAVVGAGCSLGWLAYERQLFPFLCEVVVICLAFPTWRKLFKKMIE